MDTGASLAWDLALPSYLLLDSSPQLQVWWPPAALTRSDGKLDSSP